MVRTARTTKRTTRTRKPTTKRATKRITGKTTTRRKQPARQPESKSTVSKIALFYRGVLDGVEKQTRMPSNSLRYLDPVSSGTLQLDRALSGGWHNVFSSIAGQEGSGKTTAIYHAMAVALHNPEIKIVQHIEPEGTLNTEFVGNVFSQFGLNYQDLMDDDNSPLRYYRRQVIEKIFDLTHAVLKKMPDKVWLPETESWGYIFPKRNKYFAELMEAMEVAPDKKLSSDMDYICPTEYSGVEGAVFLDSLAAMVTESDDESDTRSKIRAAEAAAFSLHLKRVVSRIGSKGLIFPATNQLRKVPGQTYGDPEYEPGGEAIKFYSAQRLRIRARAVPKGGSVQRDKEITEQAIEPSVHKEGAIDRYKYKHFKNTKNKIGFPGLRGWLRVWVSDAFGAVRGFDPYFDLSEYLKDTGQLVSRGRKKGETLFAFMLKDSVGSKRASFFNSLDPFPALMLKRLVLAEVEEDHHLYQEVADYFGVDPGILKRAALRKSLFVQVRSDKSVLQIQQKVAEDDDEDDVEEM